jgi:SAM-dependent methyltransferase
MLLNSFKQYAVEPTPKFKKGDKVYLDFNHSINRKLNLKSTPIEGPFTVKSSSLSIARIFMYTFEDYGAGVGEIYLKAAKEDKHISVKEAFHESDAQTSLKELYDGSGKISGTSHTADYTKGLMFFQPNQKMIQWIVKYAAGRLILDIGCGTGRVTMWIQEEGGRIIGCDPAMDYDGIIKRKMEYIEKGRDLPHFMPMKIEDMGKFFQGQGNKVLLMVARPCHSNFVENTLNMKDADTELLYITKPSVMEEYDDLGVYKNKAKLIEHEGLSIEQEKVWSII